jgi:hypothetical protein
MTFELGRQIEVCVDSTGKFSPFVDRDAAFDVAANMRSDENAELAGDLAFRFERSGDRDAVGFDRVAAYAAVLADREIAGDCDVAFDRSVDGQISRAADSSANARSRADASAASAACCVRRSA